MGSHEFIDFEIAQCVSWKADGHKLTAVQWNDQTEYRKSSPASLASTRRYQDYEKRGEQLFGFLAHWVRCYVTSFYGVSKRYCVTKTSKRSFAVKAKSKVGT